MCPVNLPGRESRFAEPALHNWPELIHHLELELMPLLEQPFAIFGHSLGALIAFELLRRHPQRTPRIFIASATSSPPTWSQRKHLSHLPDDELARELVALDGSSSEVLANPELFQLLLPQLRADFRLCDEYQYMSGHVLECPVVALYGQDDPAVDLERVSGWREMTSGSFKAEQLPGGHLFLRTHPNELMSVLLSHVA